MLKRLVGRRASGLATSLVFACLFSATATAAAQGLELSILSDGNRCDHCIWLQASGEIAPGDSQALVDLLNENPFVSTLQIDSPGGSLMESLKLGEKLRTKRITTVVGGATTQLDATGGRIAIRAPGTCMSACVFVLAAGVERLRVPESRLGVHQFSGSSPGVSNEELLSSTQEVSGLLMEYLEGMGTDASLIALSATAKPNEIRELGDTEAVRLSLLTSLRTPGNTQTAISTTILRDPFGDSSRLPPKSQAECSEPPFSISNSGGSAETAQARNRFYRSICLSFFQYAGIGGAAPSDDCNTSRNPSLCESLREMSTRKAQCTAAWGPAADIIKTMMLNPRYVPDELARLGAEQQMLFGFNRCR